MPYLRLSTSILATMAGIALGSQAVAAPSDVTPASAAAPSSAAGASPFLGQWELDLTRMPATYGPSPRRVVFAFADAGSGMWSTTIDITAPDGSVRHSAIRYRLDGRAAPSEGDTREADSAAFVSPAANVLVMNLGKDKRPGSVRVYTVAAGGNDMTEAAASIDDTGAPYVREFHFRRLR